jgi:DNA-binding GntR family transcriptional regulator
LPLSKRRLRQSQSILKRTYQQLKNAILLGELSSGERLVETQLAERFQISRTPVREALRLLQHDNLVVTDDCGTVRVASISVPAATQLYHCRMVLEELAIREACLNATHEDLDELRDTMHQTEKLIESVYQLSGSEVSRSAEQQFKMIYHRLLDLDYQFHRLLAKSSKNTWLVIFLDQIFDKMLMLRTQTTKHNPNVLETRVEHHKIYEALVQRNVEAGVEAVREHLAASRNRVIRELKHMQQAIHSGSPCPIDRAEPNELSQMN